VYDHIYGDFLAKNTVYINICKYRSGQPCVLCAILTLCGFKWPRCIKTNSRTRMPSHTLNTKIYALQHIRAQICRRCASCTTRSPKTAIALSCCMEIAHSRSVMRHCVDSGEERHRYASVCMCVLCVYTLCVCVCAHGVALLRNPCSCCVGSLPVKV
jgi:hypothetical protein